MLIIGETKYYGEHLLTIDVKEGEFQIGGKLHIGGELFLFLVDYVFSFRLPLMEKGGILRIIFIDVKILMVSLVSY